MIIVGEVDGAVEIVGEEDGKYCRVGLLLIVGSTVGVMDG